MDIEKIRNNFPIFLYHPELVYLDSTATSLKPKRVIEKEKEYYEQYSANIHRGIYKIAEKATAEYEQTREVVADYIGASDSAEIVFTRGATEGINMVASAFTEIVKEGDNLVATIMDHHSNFVPWQQLAKKKRAHFAIIPIREDGLLSVVEEDGITIDKTALSKFITANTKIVAFPAVSNVLGTINPVEELVKAIKEINPSAIIVVDAAQAAPHAGVDVQKWSADFVVFSAHKMLGPTGVGVLWGKKEHLKEMQPVQFGGEMVLEVNEQDTTFKDTPYKFESGTTNISGVIAFKEAIKYLRAIGIDTIREHEKELVMYAIEQLEEKFGTEIKIIGTKNPQFRAGIISFSFGTIHSHDIAQLLDDKSIAVRAGYHCTMPLHNHLNLTSSTRASFYLYTTKKDIDALIKGLDYVRNTMQK